MRIALVVTGGFDESGRERVIPSLLWLVERLARQHDVVVYVLRYHDTPRRYQLLGATICDLGQPAGLRAQYRALTAAMRADGPFDVMHGYWAMPAGLVTSLVGRRLGVPAIVTCDSGEFVALPDIAYGLQSHWRGRVGVALATRLAQRVTVCSAYQRDLAQACGVKPLVIALGVDAKTFAPQPTPPEGPPYRLLHVASINPVKDHAVLLEAVRRLIDRGLDITLDIVGEDTTGGRVAALTRTLRLEAAVTLHGFRTSVELRPLYGSAHICVLPSRHEAAGVVLLEAAASGVPVAGSAVGYLADWSPDAATSVPPGDSVALADALHELLRDPARRSRQAARAAAWVRAHDADWTASAFAALYHELAVLPTQRREDGRGTAHTPGS